MSRKGERARRVALVIGGATGIGRAVALTFAGNGTGLCIADVNRDALEDTCAHARRLGVEALAAKCDITDETSVADAVARTSKRFGRLDILVTAAGIDLHREIADTSLQEWNQVLAVNLTGGFLAIKHAAPVMARSGFGRIVCIGSTAGILGMSYAAYSASKAGLTGLIRSGVREYSRFGVTLNIVAPGPTVTPLTDRLWTADPARRDRLAAAVPVGRVAEAAEIAEAVAYLVSDRAGYVNGAILMIDGGITSVVNI
jgi:NAD(P)-dependent dehydrogenase (short-subunit alcohol dehydrogenase family)